ncbi:hypothetical protein, partial [Nocardioides massiliensis]|uniref:hypothetical protein n=1 Tax=Nocardioides massiliensis TaxID=1325935 RepID=UPI003F65D8C9
MDPGVAPGGVVALVGPGAAGVPGSAGVVDGSSAVVGSCAGRARRFLRRGDASALVGPAAGADAEGVAEGAAGTGEVGSRSVAGARPLVTATMPSTMPMTTTTAAADAAGTSHPGGPPPPVPRVAPVTPATAGGGPAGTVGGGPASLATSRGSSGSDVPAAC